MIYKQILLPFWKKYYDYEFLIGDSNKSAFSILKNIKEQIALSGPAKSGKKHLASLASKEFGFDCFLLSAFLHRQRRTCSTQLRLEYRHLGECKSPAMEKESRAMDDQGRRQTSLPSIHSHRPSFCLWT